MSWVDDNKGTGPWPFTERGNVWGYLPNPRWSAQQDAIDFCEDKGLELDQPDQHDPCGHWHKAEVTEEPFPAGKWVAAMQQPGTPYIYVYDIAQKAVIRIDTSEIPVFVSGRLELDSTYDLDYDMGRGNPGGQRGGYCMNKDGTRIWYLFTKSDGDRSDAELIEVDISKTVMRKVKSTLFSNLVPSEAFPSSVNEKINDGCSNDTHTYWCTNLVAGRVIKIKNSDHSIIDDHYFNYSIEGCGSGILDESIATIDVNKSTEKLYWVYTRDHYGCVPPYTICRHFIRSNIDLVEDIDDIICSSGAVCGNPAWQNMVRIYANHILHHRAYHPSRDGYLMKRGLDCVESDEVEGADGKRYACIKSHSATLANKPAAGSEYLTYWVRSAHSGGDVWSEGQSYTCSRIEQEYLQNIFGVKNGNVFTLMHVNSVSHPAYLYCIDFSDMSELSKLDVSYYAGQIRPPGTYDWDWTSVSAMNQQTGVIAIFRYNNVEERNYAGCFNADSNLGFLCDVPLYSIRHDDSQEMSDEPQVWIMPGDEVPAPAEPTLPGPTLPGSPPGSVICTGHTPQLSQNSISVSTIEGSSAVNHSISISDNCDVSLAFQVIEVNNNNWTPWISSPDAGDTGVGFLSINFNIMPAGNYSGNIKISTSLGNLTLNIILVVTATPAHGEPAAITLIKGELHRGFDFALGEIKLFKFRADSGPGSPLLTAVTKIQTHADLHSMVKYAGQNWEGSSLTESDYNNILAVIAADPTQSSFSSNPNPQFPAYGPINSIYYHRARFLEKTIKINYPSQITNGCWYFWIKNIGAWGSDVDLFDCKVYFDF